MSIQPIQIIGTQRSGSNMLRLMLNQFSKVTAPHPPHILQRFYPMLPVYGNLKYTSNMRHLIDDVCSLVELNPVPWHIRLNRNQIEELCEENTLFEIFRVIYNLKAKQEDASYWVCKSMTNVNYSVQLESFEQKPLYIHLIRDGRDVACSLQKTIVGDKHIYNLAEFWKKEQQACIDLKNSIGAERIIHVKYESLIQTPEKEMSRISKFLGIEYTPDIFDFYKSNDSIETAQAGKMWNNLTKPILNNNFNKYKNQLSKEDIILFEHVAGDILTKLNYTPDFPAESKALILTEKQISHYNELNNSMKKAATIQADPKDLNKRIGQKELLDNISERMFNTKEIKLFDENIYARRAIV